VLAVAAAVSVKVSAYCVAATNFALCHPRAALKAVTALFKHRFMQMCKMYNTNALATAL
jgi:hypothetical protein